MRSGDSTTRSNAPKAGDELVSVVVVSWNVRELLLSCLASLEEASRSVPCQTIVVDNGSTDGSPDAVVSSFPEIELIRNSENRGFAAAVNQGVERARGSWVLLLNPDAEIDGRSLELMRSFMRSHPDAGVVGAALVDQEGRAQPWGHRFPSLWTVLAFLSRLEVLVPRWGLSRRIEDRRSAGEEAVEVGWVTGACLLVRGEVMERACGLDEDYFIFGEDVDLCYRVRRMGWRVYHLPYVRLLHRQGASTSQVPGALEAEVFRGHMLFFGKHRTIPERVLLRLFLLGEIVIKGPIVLLLLASKRGRVRARDRLRRYGGTLAAIAGLPAGRRGRLKEGGEES